VHATPSVNVLDTHHPITAVWIIPIGKQLVRQRQCIRKGTVWWGWFLRQRFQVATEQIGPLYDLAQLGNARQ
jgi:hypothetical protein